MSSSSLLFSPLSSAAPASNLVLARSLFVKATASPSMVRKEVDWNEAMRPERDETWARIDQLSA